MTVLYTTKAILSVELSTDATNVVQIDMDGNMLASSNQAYFASTKKESKVMHGSIEKISNNEILVADAVNKRAMIVDVSTQAVKWQYNSDRYVVSAHKITSDDVVIKILNPSDDGDLLINQGQIVIWENTSLIPTVIYSGECTDFGKSFNIKLYGDEFKSALLNQGERFAFKVSTAGEYYWFSYPNIVTGRILAFDAKVASENEFIIVESDGLESPFAGRVIKVDAWGNILMEFGKGYLVAPTSASPLLNNGVLISV